METGKLMPEQTMNRTLLRVSFIAAAAMMTACANQHGLYQWGSYEDHIYAMYSSPGKSSPDEQIAKLEADGEKARAQSRTPPPGHYAHLGYLYFQTGKLDQAVASFETEKVLFPESKLYMDRLIGRIGK